MKISEYVFNIGDDVVTIEGVRGKIVDVCHCEECAKRGFFEPIWKEIDDHNSHYITVHMAKAGFSRYYKIGNYRFTPFDRKDVERELDVLERAVSQYHKLQKQLAVIDELTTKEGEVIYETVE